MDDRNGVAADGADDVRVQAVEDGKRKCRLLLADGVAYRLRRKGLPIPLSY